MKRYSGTRGVGLRPPGDLHRVHDTFAASDRRMSALVEHASEMMLVVTSEGRIQLATGAVKQVLGREPDAYVGGSILELVHPDDRGLMSGLMKRVTETENGAVERSGWRMRRQADEWVDVEVVATNLIGESQVSGVLLSCRDVSAKKASEEQLRHRAFHDPLTQLPNRALLLDRLEQAVTREDGLLGLLFIDIDDFKAVNDSQGHAAGDLLLAGVASRLRNCLRSVDTAARLGGDEFALLIVDMEAEDECEVVADRVLTTLRNPFNIQGESLHVTASIGYLSEKSGTLTVEEILCRADYAMYAAKRLGKSRSERFDPNVASELPEYFDQAERSTWAWGTESRRSEIARILKDPAGLVTAVFQPIVDMRSGLISAYEGLSRFTDSSRPPDAWFAQAHSCGLGVELEVMAARAQLEMRDRPKGMRLAINLSSSALLSSEAEALFAEHDLSEVTLELNENELIAEGIGLEACLEALRERGVRLAVDDFSVGYSGLRQVMLLKPDVLKLDHSVVHGISGDPTKASMVDAMVRHARRVGAVVCAEGIETLHDLETLANLDVTLGQGYAFARPTASWISVNPAAARICTSAMRSVIRGESDAGRPTQSSEAELERLFQMINRVSDRHELRAVLQPLRQLLAADEVAISLLNPDGDSLRTVMVDGGNEDEPYELSRYPATARAMASGEALQVLAGDIDADPSELRVLSELGYSSMLMIPLLAGGLSRGVLELFSREARPWSRAQIHSARILGCQLALVIELERHASADGGTQRRSPRSRPVSGLRKFIKDR